VSLTGEPGAAMLVLEPETPAFAGTGSPSEPVAAVAEAPAGPGAGGPGEGPPGGPATTTNGDSPGAQQRSDLSTLARGGTLNFLGALSGGVFSFLLVIVVTRGLGKPKAGAFFEAMALFQIVMNTATFGADDGLTRMIPRYIKLGRDRDIRTLLRVGLWPVIALGTIFGAVLWVFAPQLSHVFIHGTKAHADALVPYIRILAPFFPIAACSVVILAATRGFGTMVPTVALDQLGRLGSRPLGAIVVIALGLGGGALALATLGLPTLAVVVLAGIWGRSLLRRMERRARRARREGREMLPPRPVREVASEFWRFASPRAVAGIFGLTIYWLDTLLVGALRGTGDAAVYTAASRFLWVGYFALTAVQLAIGPMMSGILTTGDKQRARAVYQTATQWLTAASWPVYVTLAIFAPLFLRVFGRGYESGQAAMVTLSIAQLISIACGPVMVVLLMGGKSGWTAWNSGVSLVANIVLNLLLIPHLGMEGAALAWLVSIVINNVAGVIEVRYLLGLTPFGKGFPLVAGASLACFGGLGLLVRILFGPGLVVFLLFGLVATSTYAAIIWRFRDSLHIDLLRQGLRLRRRRMAERTASPE